MTVNPQLKGQSSMYNGKSRHIHLGHNTIRQLLSTRVISIDYIKSEDNIVDLLCPFIKWNETKAHRMKGLFYEGKPNLTN